MAAIANANTVEDIDLEPRHLEMVHSVLARHVPFKEVWAYGSRVKGAATHRSDLDLVVFDAKEDEIYEARKAFAVSEIPFEVQLFGWDQLPEHFHQNILAACYVLRAKEDWAEAKLGDVAEVIGGGTPKTSTPEYWGGEIPWLTPKDLTGYKKVYISQGDRNITEEGLKQSSAKLMPKGTVLLTSRAPIGYVAIASNAITTNQGFKSLVCNPNWSHNIFIYYWLLSNIEYIKSQGTGTTFSEVSGSVVKQLQINLPTLPEQKAIAEVLASLDDKIDLLHRQNQTLESLAETLFRQWFIEQASDDWEEKPLDKVLSVKGGTTPSTKNEDYWDGDVLWTTPRDLSNNQQMYLFDTARKITQEGLSQISSGLLPEGTLLLSSRAPVGYLAFSVYPISINQGYIAIMDDKEFSKEYLYLWLKLNMDYVRSHANGSTFQEISKTAFKQLNMLCPPEELREEFDKQIQPYFQKIKANIFQIRTLENLRDTLLPKLMSGDVRVQYDPSGQKNL